MTKIIPLMIMLLITVFFLGYAGSSKAHNFSTINTGCDAILGKWMNADKNRSVEFVKNGKAYEGIVREADKKEFIGKTLLTGLQFNGVHYTGQVYAPKRKKNYSCIITLSGTDKMTIMAKVGIMSLTKTWTRIK